MLGAIFLNMESCPPPDSVPLSSPPPGNVSSAWMLGVCGMGMGPLAIYMRGEGWAVSGWDDAIVPPMSEFLRAAGVAFCNSFPAGTPPALAGHSSAVKEGHALRRLATEKGVRLVRRGELLAERLREKQLVAVCGSHGKTTTCGMLIQALLATGTETGYVLGGLFRNADMPPARASRTSPWVVAEIDESDGTINHFAPEIAVAVNLDWDHPDYYRSVEDLEAVFARLFARTRRAVFIPHESGRLRRIAATATVPVFSVSVGTQKSSASRTRQRGWRWGDVSRRGKLCCPWRDGLTWPMR